MVADNVSRIRVAKELSYAELSRRLSVGGWSLPVLSLARLEKRERRVDVDDLIALAAALEVPPSELAPQLSLGLDQDMAIALRHRLEAIAKLARSDVFERTYDSVEAGPESFGPDGSAVRA